MPRGMGPSNAAGEKAKDFKGTIIKLIKYMNAFKIQMFFVAIFAICGTIFNIVGPKIGDDRDFQWPCKQGVRRGRYGFQKDWDYSDHRTGAVFDQCNVYICTGDPHDGGFAKDNLPSEKGDHREGQPDAHELF